VARHVLSWQTTVLAMQVHALRVISPAVGPLQDNKLCATMAALLTASVPYRQFCQLLHPAAIVLQTGKIDTRLSFLKSAGISGWILVISHCFDLSGGACNEQVRARAMHRLRLATAPHHPSRAGHHAAGRQPCRNGRRGLLDCRAPHAACRQLHHQQRQVDKRVVSC